MNERLTGGDAKQIRVRLNAAYSSVIVYGTGVDANVIPVFSKNDHYKHIVSDASRKTESWKWFLDNGKDVGIHPFFSQLVKMNDEASDMGVPNYSTHYILKTSILDTLSQLDGKSGFKLLELNGNAFEAFNPAKGSIERLRGSECIHPNLETTFPKGNYDSKKRVVETFENAYTNDLIQVALFLGASGNCPVVESMYNRALVSRSFIVVVNPDPNCYMHDLANVSIKGDANDFLDDLLRYYVEGVIHE